MSSIRTIVAVALVLCALQAASAAEPEEILPQPWDTAPCVSHPDMDLVAFEFAYLVFSRTYTPHPLDTFIPKGLEIKNYPAKFTPIQGEYPNGKPSAEWSYKLPIKVPYPEPGFDRWAGDSGFGRGLIKTSPCRVQDPTGRWWIVMRTKNGSLEYYDLLAFYPVEK